jgi:hypothetical protein
MVYKRKREAFHITEKQAPFFPSHNAKPGQGCAKELGGGGDTERDREGSSLLSFLPQRLPIKKSMRLAGHDEEGLSSFLPCSFSTEVI